MSKKTKLEITAFAMFFLFAGLYIYNVKRHIHYADFQCPICGSSEVVETGINIEGEPTYECMGCRRTMAEIGQAEN